ncbi:leucine-rich melanocyte differentiation-associated protein [Dermacentor silvarum]|nr:leucine-rich melanocyte differentiation-associated protein [Dermacentor silvarum]
MSTKAADGVRAGKGTMCAAQASPRTAQRRRCQTTPPEAAAMVAAGIGGHKRKQLSLAYEELTTVPYSLIEKYTADVEVLDLSHNRLTDVRFLSHFERLHTVILDHNCLSCLSVVPMLPTLQVLWLNYNRLLSLTVFVPGLSRSCPQLRVLSLMGNELAPSFLNNGTAEQNANYRLYVIAHFPRLVFLDDRPVLHDERRKAHAVGHHISEMLHAHEATVTRNSLKGVAR